MFLPGARPVRIGGSGLLTPLGAKPVSQVPNLALGTHFRNTVCISVPYPGGSLSGVLETASTECTPETRLEIERRGKNLVV